LLKKERKTENEYPPPPVPTAHGHRKRAPIFVVNDYVKISYLRLVKTARTKSKLVTTSLSCRVVDGRPKNALPNACGRCPDRSPPPPPPQPPLAYPQPPRLRRANATAAARDRLSDTCDGKAQPPRTDQNGPPADFRTSNDRRVDLGRSVRALSRTTRGSSGTGCSMGGWLGEIGT